MKKLYFALLAISAAFPAFAGGPLDGIYHCSISATGQSYSMYVTLNGHSDGQTIYVMAAVANNSPFKDFGAGNATASSFVGTTHDGLPFSFAVSNTGTSRSLIGTSKALINGQQVDATVNCSLIF